MHKRDNRPQAKLVLKAGLPQVLRLLMQEVPGRHQVGRMGPEDLPQD